MHTELNITMPEVLTNIGEYVFNVTLASSWAKKTVNAGLTVLMEPVISSLQPDQDATIGDTSILISWKTSSNASSEVYIRLVNDSAYRLVSGEWGKEHFVYVYNLSRNRDYNWYVRSASIYAETTSGLRNLKVSNGISFAQDAYRFDVERDYAQDKVISVINTDTESHDLLLQAINPYQDLIVGFVGPGSVDENVTIAPGEVRPVSFNIFAQDAMLQNYTFTVKLTNLGSEEIVDYALVYVNVRQPNINLEIMEIALNNFTLTKTFKIINHGDTVTDLSIALDGPAKTQVAVRPQVNHALLRTGESLVFDAVPTLTIDFVSLQCNLLVTAIGRTAEVPVNFSLPPGKSVFIGNIGYSPSRFVHEPPLVTMVFTQQLFSDSVVVNVNTVFNNSNPVFMLREVLREGNDFMMKVDSLGDLDGDYVLVPEFVHTLLNGLSVGNYSVAVVEAELGSILVNSNFTVDEFGVLFSNEELSASVLALKGGLVNGTYCLSSFPSNPILPPNMFEFCNVWANSSDSFVIGMNVTNLSSGTLGDLNFTLTSSVPGVRFDVNSISLNQLLANSSVVFCFNISMNEMEIGIHNFSYSIDYIAAGAAKNVAGVLKVGVYNAYWSWLDNDTMSFNLDSPFGDSFNQTLQKWVKYQVLNTEFLEPSSIEQTYIYNNSTEISNSTEGGIQKPRIIGAIRVLGLPAIVIPAAIKIVAPYVVAGVAGGLVNLGAQLQDNGGNWSAVNWWDVGKTAAATSGALVYATFTGGAATPGLILAAGIPGGIETSNQMRSSNGQITSYSRIVNSMTDGLLTAEILGLAALGSAAINVIGTGHTPLPQLPETVFNYAANYIHIGHYNILMEGSQIAARMLDIASDVKKWLDYGLPLWDLLGSGIAAIQHYFEPPSGSTSVNRTLVYCTWHSPWSLNDTDGDGFSDIDEIIGGTDPFDPNSTLGVTVEIGTHDWYCTNRPYIECPWVLPPCIPETASPEQNVDEANLIIHFILPYSRDTYKPHNVHLYINNVEIGNLTNTIPEGYYMFPFNGSILNYALNGLAQNVFALKMDDLNGGHYAVSTDMEIVLHAKRLTLAVVASNQTEADNLIEQISRTVATLPDFATYSKDMSFSNPQPNEGDNITLTARIFNFGTAGMLNVPIDLFVDSSRVMTVLIPAIPPFMNHTVAFNWTATRGTHEINIKVNDGQTIPESDYSNNQAQAGIAIGAHDLAIPDVVSPKRVVGRGYPFNIAFTVTNNGTFTETFNVTVYANMTRIGRQTLTLTGGASTILTFMWNTSGVVYGNYTIAVYAEPVPSETLITDNNCTCITPIHVGVPGDVSGTTTGVYDGTCNMRDINYLILLFNKNPSLPGWNPNADVNNDGVINMRDIGITIQNFNKHE